VAKNGLGTRLNMTVHACVGGASSPV